MTQFLSPCYLRFTCCSCEVERLESRDSPFQTANSNWSRMLERLNLRREGSREAGSEGERQGEDGGFQERRREREGKQWKEGKCR